MNKLIENWLAFKRVADEAREDEERVYKRALKARMPGKKRLRPAGESDVVKGRILWYLPNALVGEPKWVFVEEVFDQYVGWEKNGYIGHDGCRYGLDGAFVEIEP